MVDAVLLPNGKLLIVNGVRFGVSNGGGPGGGGQARSPVYEVRPACVRARLLGGHACARLRWKSCGANQAALHAAPKHPCRCFPCPSPCPRPGSTTPAPRWAAASRSWPRPASSDCITLLPC